jgi:hypothetical protein
MQNPATNEKNLESGRQEGPIPALAEVGPRRRTNCFSSWLRRFRIGIRFPARF